MTWRSKPVGPRAIVAQFVKWGNGEPIRLFTFTVIQAVEGHDGKTHTSRDEYDVEWSKTCGYYLYHMSGSGGRATVTVRGVYHLNGDAAIKERAADWVSERDRPPWKGKRTLKIRRRNRTRRLRQLPMCINEMQAGWDLLDWLEHNAKEDKAVYCSECDDWLPDEYPCDHIWWCSKTGWWSTPSERCGCKDMEECDG